MLASKVTFFPQLRGTLPNARSPRLDHAYKGASEMLAPISSTNTSRSAWISLATNGDQRPPSCPQELVSLARTHTPFFLLHPRRLSILLTVDSLTRTPAAFCRNARLSERVAVGCLCTSASKSFVVLWSILGLEPGRFLGARLGARERPSSTSLAERLTEERLTEKVRAASLLVMPRRRAAMIFFLRSSE